MALIKRGDKYPITVCLMEYLYAVTVINHIYLILLYINLKMLNQEEDNNFSDIISNWLKCANLSIDRIIYELQTVIVKPISKILAVDLSIVILILILQKKLWENMGRVKPHPLDKDRERHLQRIATR